MAPEPRKKLDAFIKARGETLNQLSEQTEISRQTIAKWLRGEGGEHARTRRLMVQFCEKLGAAKHKLFPDIFKAATD